MSITPIEKVLYTAKTHTTGGRDGGASRTSDGRRDHVHAAVRRIELTRLYEYMKWSWHKRLGSTEKVMGAQAITPSAHGCGGQT